MADPYALRRVSARRLREWMLYEEVEPFGELRADYRAASIRETVFNVAVANSKHRKTVEECMIKFVASKPKKPKTWQEMQKVALQIVEIYNAPGKTT